MMTDNSTDNTIVFKSSCIDSIRFDLKKMTISRQEPAISSNEYYYEYGLNEIELNGILQKSLDNPSTKIQKVRSRKKKLENRQVNKVETIEGKFKNLSITVTNEKFQKTKNSQSSSNSMKDTRDKNLVKKLKLLQKGEITSEAIIMNDDLKLLKNKKKNEKKRDEVVRLNQQIQEKITQVKPRLLAIMNGSKSLNGNNESIPPELSKPVVIATKDVHKDVEKSKVSSSSSSVKEIYRYTLSELYSLQTYSTWKMIPRLLKLNICHTKFSPLDEFIFKLLGLPEQERNEAILKQAERSNFIRRKKGQDSFSYLSPNFHNCEESPAIQNQPVPVSKVVNDIKPDPDHIDRIRLIAKNDEELNDLIYQHEFINLFETSLKDQDIRNQSHENILKHLLENNQAFIIDGEIRVNQRNNQEAYVSHPKGMKDICISKMILRKHSYHGDFVRVLVKKDGGNENEDLNVSNQSISDEQLINDDLEDAIQCDLSQDSRNFGCVLEILEKRHSRRVVGSFASFTNIKKNRKFLMVNVRDAKIPNIRIDTRTGIPKDVEFNDKMLLTVEIIGWNYDQPQGKVVSIIGKKGQLKTENIAILQQNNLDPRSFDQNILDQLPREPFSIPAKEFEYREDLRKKCIFSIDPETARDLDDALSCETLSNGNLEIGVHISDVSYFVQENSDLDTIVKEKATTIYLVDAVYHMLPEQLCLLCSLLPGTDKLAYSVFFEMNPKTAEIYKTRFTRSIVNSCAKLSYDHAQFIIERTNQDSNEIESKFPEILNGFSVSDVADVITKLQSIAIILRENRKANGALKINQPKLSFIFANNDERMDTPVDFFKYSIKDSNRLIEEFMLLANISVATFIHQKFPKISLLRHHSVPNESSLKKLVKSLNKYGIQFDTTSSASISKSMESIIASAKSPSGMNAALNHMVSKSMQRAKYFCSELAESSNDFWHYALSIPMYTHFTSPIRRYADILVHRVLNSCLDYEGPPSRKPEEIQALASVCNAQKYNAKLAGDDSSNLYFMHFIQSLKMKTMKAGVVGVFDYNLEVVLVDTGHLVKVYYKNLQQNDDIAIRTFIDNSPPYVSVYLHNIQSSMNIEFGMELLVHVEVVKDKLVINKIFYNLKS